MNTKFKTRYLLASALASTLVLQSAVSYADDTEIFFGGTAIDAGIQPNVLFILDNSGSMSGTRMTQLKDAFNTIITSAGKINVGVMTMNNANPRLLSPVQDINKSMNIKLSTPEVIESGDDASYNSSTAATTIADPTLVMGYVNSGSSPGSVTRNLGTNNTSTFYTENASYYVVTKSSVDYACSAKIVTAGTNCTAAAKTQINSTSGTSGNDGLMLFRNLNIPSGATITAAKLILTPTSTTANSGKQPALQVKLENTKTAAAFNSDTSLAGRTFSVSNLQTTVAAANLTSGEVVLNIGTQLTNLKALAPTNNPIADIAVRVRGTTATDYSWYIGNGSGTAPRLEVTWTGSESSTRTTGIRFQNVAIPKGATITSARIDFVPAASDDRAVTYSVTAQSANDAALFATTENFTSRTKTTTSSTWTPYEWKTAAPQVYVEGPIVTAQVQSVIDNNAGWCGNNNMAFFITPTSGTGNRTAFAVDAGNNLQPVLNVSYTGGDSGCLNPVVNISVFDTKDDAYQSATGQSAVLTGSTIAFTNGFIGTRYVKVPVKKNATVLEASIIATPNNTTAGTATVYFENEDNSAAFAATNNNISSRNLTSTGASCTFTPIAAGTPITCSATGIKTQLQSIFNRTNWADGNSLSVIMKPTSSAFAMRTRENSATAALRLRIKLSSGGLGTNSYTIRDYTNGIVQALVASGGTPIVPTLYDAAGYLTQTTSKHVGSTPSPITSSCQANYLVFLTDGEANGTTTAAKDGIATLTGGSCATSGVPGDEVCARDLVEWMATHDMAEYEGLNTVKTSTIGFNTSGNKQATALLNDLAKKGGGTAYQAEDAADLANAFDDIVQSALATNTTFVSASAPVNAFKSSENLDERYYALFRPSEFNRWTGNVKRYKSKVVNGVTKIVDADDTVAIDKNTGFFGANTRSYWSNSQDGNDVAKGGAAANLPAPADRHLYTYTGTAPTGTATALETLSASNAGITKLKLGDASMDDTVRNALLSYIRGGPDATGTTNRSALGDPIHASPELVTYGCNTYVGGKCTSPDISLLIGTNEGFVQSFDTDTGVEEFGFMPQELLPNIKTLRDNVKSSSQKPRLYGMDNTVSVWVNDVNKNGVIYGDPTTGAKNGLNTGEFVYAYATMGRGGRNIYALDITDRSSPKILWQILGGTTAGFERLGQTWSTPVKTKIKIGSTITDVLIFAGGYDPAQDALNLSNSVNTADSMGNSIYIVNAKTGAKIWSASNTATGHTLQLEKMKYSMPGAIKAIDIQENASGVLIADSNKLTDQFFATDTGGQVWRFYVNNGSTGSSLVSPGGNNGDGVFASIAGTTAGSARKFYNEPDVAVLNVNGNRTLTVNVGSGYRGHPLNEYITDRFYSFRTPNVFKSANDGTLVESNLYDATQNLIQSGSDDEKQAAKNALKATSGGWYITLTNAGEKVLAAATTQAGELFFNTYEPSTATAACSAAVGVNRAYAVKLLDATPKVVPEGSNGTAADRSRTSTSGGIAGKPLVTCSAGDKCEESSDLPLDNYDLAIPPQGKTYWIDQSNLD